MIISSLFFIFGLLVLNLGNDNGIIIVSLFGINRECFSVIASGQSNCGCGYHVPISVVNVKSPAVYSYIDDFGKTAFKGQTVSFFNYLTEAFGWKFRHVQKINIKWGDRLPNGSYNGMIGMVQRKEVEMAASAIKITHDRERVVDFSFPYAFDSLRLTTRKPGYAPKWEVLTWPFQIYLWIAIIATFILFSLLSYLIFILAQDKSYTFVICVMESYKVHLTYCHIIEFGKSDQFCG